MFKVKMCAFLKDGVSFREFVERGGEWAQAYERDLQTYLSGFSFEKVKREIAEEDARFAEHVSKILGDITTKVLSLPLSAGLVMILKSQANNLPWWFPILLLAMVAFAIIRLVRHYQQVVCRVEQDIDMVFDKMKTTNSVVYPKDLNDLVNVRVKSLKRETKKLRITLCIYLIAAWALPAIGVMMEMGK